MVLYSGVVNMTDFRMKGIIYMLWYHYLLGSILIISAVIIVIAVMLQQSQQQGLSGAIAGGADTFFDKNKGRTKEAKLAKITKVLAVVFFVTALASVIIFAFVK